MAYHFCSFTCAITAIRLIYSPRFKPLQFLTLIFAVFLAAGLHLILTTCLVMNGLIAMTWPQSFEFHMAAAAILTSGPFSHFRLNICILHRICEISTKFVETWSNIKGMATVFRNSRWQQPPS